MTTINPTTRTTTPAAGTSTQTTATKPGPGQIGLGSKGPEVQQLKTLLRDAGFYNGAINQEMGQQGIDALKKAKTELKLGGPADISGPTTVDALKKAIASRASGSDFGAQLRSGNLTQTPIYLAIGLAEGTLNKNGSPNQAWYGHGDPGNDKLNKGFGSYQVYQDPRGASLKPEQADRIQANRLAGEWPTIDQALTRAGIPAGPTRDLVAASALDAWNQAPATHGGVYGLLNPSRLGELKNALASGKNPTDAIVDWRANGYRRDNGTLNAPGLGNSMSRVMDDQRRRTEAVAEGLRLRAGSSVPSSGGQPAYQPTTPTQAPVNIGGTPSSGTGELLAKGAMGPEVSKLQEALNKAGANPPLAVDGDFGPATEAAVTQFQQRNNLAPDGVVGPMTQAAMAKAQSPSTSGSAGANGGGTLNAGTLGSINNGQYKSSFEIKPGSKGPEVERLKKALTDAGFYTGAINQEMGAQGVEALKKAKEQLKLGGAPDVAGEFTLKKIEEFARTQGSAGGATGASGAAGLLKPVRQQDATSCGLTSIAMITNAVNAKTGTGARPITDQDLRAENGGGTGFLPNVMNQHLKGTGFRATNEDWSSNSWNLIDQSLKAGNPVMISTNGEFSATGFGHYIALTKVEGDRVQYADPADGQLKWTTKQTLDAQPPHSVDGRWMSRIVQ